MAINQISESSTFHLFTIPKGTILYTTGFYCDESEDASNAFEKLGATPDISKDLNTGKWSSTFDNWNRFGLTHERLYEDGKEWGYSTRIKATLNRDIHLMSINRPFFEKTKQAPFHIFVSDLYKESPTSFDGFSCSKMHQDLAWQITLFRPQECLTDIEPYTLKTNPKEDRKDEVKILESIVSNIRVINCKYDVVQTDTRFHRMTNWEFKTGNPLDSKLVQHMKETKVSLFAV